MPSLLERLAEALAPEFRVEREIARGGMGIVFLARDVALDRPVAIKIIRPELATARAADRFLREARIMATVQHPNVVPIFHAGEANGFFYYVMEYVEGETLAERLRAGKPAPKEVFRLARDVLWALQGVHDEGVIHRDLKPSNIFFTKDGRALIADFGIAKPSEEPLHGGTTEGRVIGTLGYMSPEQAWGFSVTESADIYAAGVVLYEAFTGRAWATQMHEARPDWSGIPRGVTSILRRALLPKSEDRWPDARSFRRALRRKETAVYRRRTAMLTAAGLLFGSSVVAVFGTDWLRSPPLADIAVLPFEIASDADSATALNLALATETNLEHSFFRVVDHHEVTGWWRGLEDPAQSVDPDLMRDLQARFVVSGTVLLDLPDTVVRVQVADRNGNRLDAGSERLDGSFSVGEAGRRLGLLVVKVIAPERERDYVGSPVLGRSDSAFTSYIQGRVAFEKNQFGTATELFTAAWTATPEWGLAQWWLDNAHRWMGTGEPHPNIDMSQLRDRHADDLPEQERMLLDAQLANDQEERHRLYRETIRRFPHSGYASFFYGDELLMRGPHAGVPLETAAAQLDSAVFKDPSSAPAQCQLTWANIRLGRPVKAQTSADACRAVSAAVGETEIPQGLLMPLLVAVRFDPEQGQTSLMDAVADPELAGWLAQGFRLGAMYDMADLQLAIGSLSLDAAPDVDSIRVHFHEGIGLALIGLGRVEDGLVHISRAAELQGSVDARLEAAEWPVIGRAIGLPGISEAALRNGLGQLNTLRADPATHSRAAWALGVWATRNGDLTSAEALLDSLGVSSSDSAAQRLGTLLRALVVAARGNHQRALHVSAELLPNDSAGRGGDPFARAVLHLVRAEWLDSLGRIQEFV